VVRGEQNPTGQKTDPKLGKNEARELGPAMPALSFRPVLPTKLEGITATLIRMPSTSMG
jgi:hypothetical protein